MGSTPQRSLYPEADFEDDFVAFLHRCTTIGRWLFVLLLWLSFGIPAIWSLRDEIHLWYKAFTWVAVLYGFQAHLWSSFALAFCVGMILSTLVWQSRNILWGLSPAELARLSHYAHHLRQQRTSSTLWLWFCCLNRQSRG